jgi:hypothetical protein
LGTLERANLNHWRNPVSETLHNIESHIISMSNNTNQLKISVIKPAIIIFCHPLDVSLLIIGIDTLKTKCTPVFFHLNSNYRYVSCAANTATKKLGMGVSK